jgi:hypothetical protein
MTGPPATDVDVLGGKGQYIEVGGPAKGVNLGKFGRQLQILQAAAEQNGTTAEAYLQEGTSQQAIDLAKKRLGSGNVHKFKLPGQ